MTQRGYITPAWRKLGELPEKRYDVVVVGAGVAGMTAALSIDPSCSVALVSKAELAESSTHKAQGGMAVAVGPDDSVQLHFDDTMRVGQGACRKEAVAVLTAEGPAALAYLQTLGADFCRDGNGLTLTREGGHSCHRVANYYDYTGRHIAETLAGEVERRSNIEPIKGAFLVDLLTAAQGCCGCLVEVAGRLIHLRAGAVVVATGGYSGLFARSTNALSSCGDGIAAAYRAGVVLSDMEFVQFHPTAFTTLTGKAFLLTEAFRGEGALLLNEARERFMPAYHESAELAPRDVVSRAMLRETERQGGGSLYLDARHFGKDYLVDRFRQVYAELAKNNYYMERDIIPIAPAAHYTIGGIKTDLYGRTSLPCLYACGEAAATGVHGANRLASNSLLEGVVFGRRVAACINGSRVSTAVSGALCEGVLDRGPDLELSVLQSRLEAAAGVVRQADGLSSLLSTLKTGPKNEPGAADRRGYQASNAGRLAALLVEAALLRKESRGVHYRTDFPDKCDADAGKHTLQQWGKEAVLA